MADRKDSSMNGILNISKPQEMTSHDVIAIVRLAAGMKKVGHTGTLDPMATGVLPVCFGSATRIMEYLDADVKVYECVMRLGLRSDTDDIWGTMLDPSEKETGKAEELTDEEIRAAFVRYEGTIDQVPPLYSALKVKGRKLYEYARSGQKPEIKARKVRVDRLEVEDICRGKYTDVRFTVVCSKGTYIRSLCRDIGDDLGCGGLMKSLTRKASGIFTIDEAVDIEKVRNMEPREIQELLVPADRALAHFGEGVVKDHRVRPFLNGLSVYKKDVKIKRMPLFSGEQKDDAPNEKYPYAYCLYGDAETGSGKDFLGVALLDEEEEVFRADKVFFR